MATQDTEDDDEEFERISLAGTKTYDNLRSALSRKALAMVRYEYYAQKADVEGLTEAAQVMRALSNSAREQAYGHMEFLDEGEEDESDSSSTEMNIEACLAQEKSDFEDKYPSWAVAAYDENISDVGTWMESLRDTTFRNMKRLVRLQESIEDLYKDERDEMEPLSAPNPNGADSSSKFSNR